MQDRQHSGSQSTADENGVEADANSP